MLGQHLSGLDVPSDGSAKLVSVNTTFDDAGCRTWTVVFREVKPAGGETPPPAASVAPKGPTAPACRASSMSNSNASSLAPSPAATTKTVGFAPGLTKPATPKTPIAPSSLVPAASPNAVKDMQTTMMDRIFPLKCQAKTYAWGKYGADSLVGFLAGEGLEELEVSDNVPYAELWMGTHPSGPAMVMLSSPWRTVTPLSEWIKLNPSLLGPPRAPHNRLDRNAPRIERRKSMLRMAEASLPFLFKVLSVRTALSIQAHPDKALAAKLHARQPDMYKDDNHKPEMAVAITPFEALCSFQPAWSILENCRATPELVALIGEDCVAKLDDAANARSAAERADEKPLSPKGSTTPRPFADDAAAAANAAASAFATADAAQQHFKGALREVFRRLLTAPSAEVEKRLDALMRRITSTNPMLRAPVDVLAARLHEQYPGDVGVFCAYLLNYHVLQPGEALFLAANEPHAYLSGDCAEIMATSDNVVRAGLTPKWKDVETLCDCLTYKDGAPHVITPTQSADEPHVWRYTPPAEVDEFVLDRIELPAGDDGASGGAPPVASLGASSGLSILIVVRGVVAIEQLDDASEDAVGLRHQLAAGAVHLVCPHTVLKLRPLQGPVLAFLAAPKPFEDDIVDLNTGLTLAA